jgi:hypothetical protein
MIETNAILAISSLDRYTTQNTNIFTNVGPVRSTPATQNFGLVGSYQTAKPYSNDFQINTPGVLTYGYISKIIVSQIQLQYNIPTVNSFRNNFFLLQTGEPDVDSYFIFIPSGFYTPSELAAVVELQIKANAPLIPYNFDVSYNQELNKFDFTTALGNLPFRFPNLSELLLNPQLTPNILNNILKTYKLLGIGVANGTYRPFQTSQVAPDFLYTPYIDIYSNALTAYQKLSDGNSTVARPKGLISRVYLSGVGGPQNTRTDVALGSAPFVVTLDLNSPKVIKWTKDVAINSIDFELRDCYGDLIPIGATGAELDASNTPNEESFQTEFQMTLLCVEGEQEY